MGRTGCLKSSFLGLGRETGCDEIMESSQFWLLLALCYQGDVCDMSPYVCVSRMAVVLSGVSWGHKVMIWVRTGCLESSFRLPLVGRRASVSEVTGRLDHPKGLTIDVISQRGSP